VNLATAQEIIADNLSSAGWSWGCVSAIDANGRTIWIADSASRRRKAVCCAHGGKADSFLELESQLAVKKMDFQEKAGFT
jgi:hypothetical protein